MNTIFLSIDEQFYFGAIKEDVTKILITKYVWVFYLTYQCCKV